VTELPPDFSALITRCVAGDRVAATELVERTHPWVLKWVRAHRSRTFRDEDLVQEVYLTMFAKLDRYSPRDGIPFAHWLSRVTVNTCLDVLRAEGRRPRSVALSAQAREWLESLTCERDVPLEHARSASELVDVLLAQLPPEDRLVLTLLDLRQLSVAQVAEATGWNKTLVRVRAFRARRRLRVIAERRAEEQRS
jgi:RNA polymerase sigma-70 factor (ECF subfamily)